MPTRPEILTEPSVVLATESDDIDSLRRERDRLHDTLMDIQSLAENAMSLDAQRIWRMAEDGFNPPAEGS